MFTAPGAAFAAGGEDAAVIASESEMPSPSGEGEDPGGESGEAQVYLGLPAARHAKQQTVAFSSRLYILCYAVIG